MTERKDIARAYISTARGDSVVVDWPGPPSGRGKGFWARGEGDAQAAVFVINEALDAVWVAAQLDATKGAHDGFTSAQNVIAALRDDVERLNQENTRLRDDRDSAVRSCERYVTETKTIRDEIANIRATARGWERRAKESEDAITAIRAGLGDSETRTPKEVADEVRDRLAEKENGAESDALVEAHHAAELAILGNIREASSRVEGDADEALKYAQAFSALRGAR